MSQVDPNTIVKMKKVVRHAVINNLEKKKYFIKIYEGDVLEEYEKAKKLETVAESTSNFTTPKPLHVVNDYQLIIWEYLPDLINLRQYLFNIKNRNITSKEKEELYRHAFTSSGCALATIHKQLNIDGNNEQLEHMNLSSPQLSKKVEEHVKSVIEKSPIGNIHGDFTCVNVFAKKQGNNEKMIIVDSSPNIYLYKGVTTNARCNVYWEISLFIKSLYSNNGFFNAFSKNLDFFIDAFLAGYSKEYGTELDRTTIFACAASILRLFDDFSKTFEEPGRKISLSNMWEKYFRKKMISKLFSRTEKEYQTQFAV